MPDDPDDEVLFAEMKGLIEEEYRKSSVSTSIVVYCDRHLGVAMIPCVNWRGSEARGQRYNDPLDGYRCPAPGCERCYDPWDLGYHTHSGKMGSRIQAYDIGQARCGNHEGMPFLYIGKVAQGRQYLCPLYKCERVGETIADCVVDETVVPTSDQAVVNREEQKRMREMEIFRAFASVANLGIDESSVVSGSPPHPDIGCKIEGNPCWFELGEVISKEVAEKINPTRRDSEERFSVSQESALCGIVKKKKAKSYETHGAPVNLILHFDLRFGSSGVVAGLIDKNIGCLRTLVTTGPFARVWVYDAFGKTIPRRFSLTSNS